MEMQRTATLSALAQAGKTRWGRLARTVGIWFLAITLACTSILLVAGQVAKGRIAAHYPPPGRLVDIGGYRLHLSCQGTGGPTVVIEAGGGDFGLHWALVQPAVAKQTRVCVYDRAGLGWSDPSPRPRTAAVMAEELHTLLQRAAINGPYLLVGHSIGGLVVRQFAVAHPADVAGMVLVDSASEQQMARFPVAYRTETASIPRMLRLISLAGDAGLLALASWVIPHYTQLPPDIAAAIHGRTVASGQLFRTFLAEMTDTDADPTLRPATLGDIPLVVLRRERADTPVRGAITQETVQELETTWAQMQEELAALSPQGRTVVAAGSGHGIPLQRPDLIIAAISEVLAAAR